MAQKTAKTDTVPPLTPDRLPRLDALKPPPDAGPAMAAADFSSAPMYPPSRFLYPILRVTRGSSLLLLEKA
jgi:hypothetical protein